MVTTCVIDLDGVVWRGDSLLAGADAAIGRLLDSGVDVVFCTNHAHSPLAKRQQLERLGVPAAPVVTSAEAAAASCTPGGTVLAMGAPSLLECLGEHGLTVIDVFSQPEAVVPEVDAVVVGACPDWDRSRVGMVADAVRAGARFLATNDDPTYPVTGPNGPRLLPGNGALVAAVAATAGTPAVVTGKPYAPMAELLIERHGEVDMVIGDKPETDGALAERLGAHFGLVLTGVTSAADLPVTPEPSIVAADLAELVDRYLVDHLGGAAADGPPRPPAGTERDRR